MPDWGPSHQTGRQPPVDSPGSGFGAARGRGLGLLQGADRERDHLGVTGIAIALILVLVALVVIDAIITSRARAGAPRAPAIPADGDPLRAIRDASLRRRRRGVARAPARMAQWKFARPERAVLLLGPPRSGKTSGVIIPALLAHAGPAVVDLDQARRRPGDRASPGARRAGVGV